MGTRHAVVRSLSVVCGTLEVSAGDCRAGADWEKASTQNKNFLTLSEAQRRGGLLLEIVSSPSVGVFKQGPFYKSVSASPQLCRVGSGSPGPDQLSQAGPPQLGWS